ALRGQMRRHDDTVFRTVGYQQRLDVEGGTEAVQHDVPEVAEIAVADRVLEVDARCRQDAVIAVELAVGEPEAVVGTAVEPAGTIVLRTGPENVGSIAEVVGNAVEEFEQVVGAAVEGRLALRE